MGVCNLHFRVKVLSSYVYPRPYFIIFFVKTHYNFMFIFHVYCWTLKNKHETHNTIIHLFNTHTYYISNLHLIYLYILNCLFCILCLCYFVYCLFCIFVYYYLYYLCLVLSHSFCCTVELLPPKQIPRMCNIPGNKAISDSDYKNLLENLEGTSRELVFTVLVRFWHHN